jgi:hypothetical protein
MMKVLLLLKRRPGLSLAEFIERYETVHVPLAEKHATTMRHYERRYLHPGSHVLFGDVVAEPEYDVITELWYDDVAAFTDQQDDLRRRPEQVAAIIEDEEKLFDRAKSRLVFVEDHVSDLSSGGLDAGAEVAMRRLLDKDAIIDLVHRYSYLVDHRLHDELAELFTQDCLVDYGPGFGPPAHGRRAFRALFGRSEPLSESRPGFLVTSHHNANVLVDLENDARASVRTSVYAWHRTTQGVTPRVWGYYHDVVVRTPDGWRFAERQLRVAGSQDWDMAWHPLIGESADEPGVDVQ